MPHSGHTLLHGRSDHYERNTLFWLSRKCTLRVDYRSYKLNACMIDVRPSDLTK